MESPRCHVIHVISPCACTCVQQECRWVGVPTTAPTRTEILVECICVHLCAYVYICVPAHCIRKLDAFCCICVPARFVCEEINHCHHKMDIHDFLGLCLCMPSQFSLDLGFEKSSIFARKIAIWHSKQYKLPRKPCKSILLLFKIDILSTTWKYMFCSVAVSACLLNSL